MPRFTINNLVSDQPGVAAHTDAALVNAWGISHAPGGPLWISDNGTDKSSVYSSTGAPQFSITLSPGAPTGTVYVPNGGFVIHKGATSGSALFLFDTESGAIEGWSPSVDQNGVVALDNSANGAVYKGLALDGATNRLFAANFAKNKVEIYNSSFGLVSSFTDTALPRHFAPFNVAVLNGKVYVAFAKRERRGIDELHKRGLGYVDVFDTSGNLQKRLLANGALNAPWGMTIAPGGFGKLTGALLVGNFGDGRIHAYDANTGDLMATLKDTDGSALSIDGLWALDADSGVVDFTAGPGDESHGLLGNIAPAP
ncbi:MAG TPA: TIGR03118 family protein [Rhizomicrobium sp.]